ncbi:nitroreductase family protein [Alkaliphilus transvaalensis]|uniref:nitroreductase family protein n=1 Tax=Alkaliphilus transvaalensis TaxID=114628 RepID=UPI00047C16B7|nr:nitroreductase family protein [Alkaliphilus transvaalensis]
MFFQQPITEIIKNRVSVRSYSNENLSEEVKKQINSYLTSIEGPFEAETRFQMIDREDIKINNGKIGTYGVIKGANTYIAGMLKKGDYDLEELGYVFEKAILFLTSIGLGTCWLGGTFKRSGVEEIVGLQQEEMLPVITPVGYGLEKKRFIDSTIRLIAGSNNRKDWKELFFNNDFDEVLNKESAAEYKLPLEMVRLAPSASNKQPWRIVKDDQRWHFYMESTKGYSKALGYDIQRIDMGIAMCHFEMTLIEAGLKGKWQIESNVPKKEEVEYIITWIQESF